MTFLSSYDLVINVANIPKEHTEKQYSFLTDMTVLDIVWLLSIPQRSMSAMHSFQASFIER